MPSPQPIPEPPRPRLRVALERAMVPLLLFTFTSAALLSVSAVFLLPRLTRVEIGGRFFRAPEILDARTQLSADILAREERRRMLTLSVDDDAYRWLKEERSKALDFLRIEDEVRNQAAGFSRESADTDAEAEKETVVIVSVGYDLEARTVEVRGDVRNVGFRSMTVLAQFADALARLPDVASVKPPAFVREDDPEIGLHSPFTLTLVLR